MAYSIIIKEKALSLRDKGYSINEIHRKLGVSKGRISEWVRGVVLSDKSKLRLLNKVKLGVIISSRNKKERTKKIIDSLLVKAVDDVNKVSADGNLFRIFCALIYWCEGGKDLYSGMRFTNSDPRLVNVFLGLLRKSFEIDSSKFRVCVHLHPYHNRNNILKFWSGVTRIPLKQFIKPFYKTHTGKRVRKDYNGCVSIRYHDVIVGRQLLMIARAFLLRYSVNIFKIRA